MRSLVLLIITAIVGCGNPATDKSQAGAPNKRQTEIDSLIVAEKKYQNKVASSTPDLDTVGVSNSPVEISNASLVEKEYSSRKDLKLTFRNRGSKTIEGIKFMWYGLNVFGEPAEMGNYGNHIGIGSGFMDKKLKPGQSMSLVWDISSKDAKKIVAAWPFEIVFSDGTKWSLE